MENKCPNCGKKIQVIIEGSAKNYKCEYCGYECATTIAEGVEWDPKNYIIYLESNNSIEIENIKLISSISGLNFIKSKEILQYGGILLSSRATKIKDIIYLLKKRNIKFNIEPKFLYD